MAETNGRNGNSTSALFKAGTVVVGIILSGATGALTSWLFKLDDRVFNLSAAVAAQVTTQDQLKQMNDKIDAMSADLHRLIGAYESQKHRR